MNEVTSFILEVCTDGLVFAKDAYLIVQSNPIVQAAQPVIAGLGVILGAISGYEIGRSLVLRARGLWSPSLARPVILLTAVVALGFCASPYVAAAIAVAVIGFAILGAVVACFDKRPVDLTKLTFEQYQNTIGAVPTKVDPISVDEFLAIENPESRDVSGMVWGFMRTACEKGDAFTEGTFVFEGDKGEEIYNKLLALKASYERESSHYKGRIKVSMGLDVPDEHMMPANKRTILFGLADTEDGNKTFFIKPENYGADVWGSFESWNKAAHCFHHTREFIFAQYVKIMRPGYDDLPGTAKERIPHEWSVGSMYGWSSLSDKQKQDLIDRGLAKQDWVHDTYRTGREVYIKL